VKLGKKIDGFPIRCIDDTTRETLVSKLADFVLKSFDGGQVLEVAKVSSQSIDGVNYSLPDPQIRAKIWLQIVLFMKMAGPRASPQ
jgi:hypothetical protein